MGVMRNIHKIFLGKLEGRDQFGHLKVDKRIILN
jgi:hypothetical protein